MRQPSRSSLQDYRKDEAYFKARIFPKSRSVKEIIVNSERFALFLSEEKIKRRVKELARQINKDYRDRVPIFIGVLNGSFIFFADLIREITIDCEVDFLKLSSYGDAKISSGDVKVIKELNCQVR